MPLSQFRTSVQRDAQNDTLRDGSIGEGMMIPGLSGDVRLVYADYVASGRALRQVEDFVSQHVLPYYANSHTEASWCGAYTTRLREDARHEIARLVGARNDDAVIFTGSGTTAGLNRLVSLFGVEKADQPIVFIGPYEHHSNILPWRESKALIVEIPEAAGGGPDLNALACALEDHKDAVVVSPWRHVYLDDLVAREEAGTPNVIGDIRAALAFIVKDVVGADQIARREARFNQMALKGWGDNPHLTLLGTDKAHRLPIFSFLVRDATVQFIIDSVNELSRKTAQYADRYQMNPATGQYYSQDQAA